MGMSIGRHQHAVDRTRIARPHTDQPSTDQPSTDRCLASTSMTAGPIVVTGGAGLLGRRVVAHARRAGVEVVAPASTVLDITDAAAVTELAVTVQPTVVVHLAYRKDDERVIVDGTRNVARAASVAGAHLVHLSTDALFAGRPEPYGELDPPTPITDYGRWKAAAEAAVIDAAPTAVIVRTSIMYATDELAPCQRDVVDVLAGRSTMRFFTDEVRCFTHVDDVASAVLTVAAERDVTGVLHLAASRSLDRAAFARAVAAWVGLDPAAVPTDTIEASGLDRPGVVVLDTSRARSLGLRCRDVDESFTATPPP